MTSEKEKKVMKQVAKLTKACMAKTLESCHDVHLEYSGHVNSISVYYLKDGYDVATSREEVITHVICAVCLDSKSALKRIKKAIKKVSAL